MPPKKSKKRHPRPLIEEHPSPKPEQPRSASPIAVASSACSLPSSSPPAKKPKMTADVMSSDLLSRLNAFMPEMEAANEELETEIAAGTVSRRKIEISDGEEGEESYIEMDLGLGVLEEKRPRDISEEEDDSGNDENNGDDDDDNEDIMLKLLNSSKRHGKGPRGKPSIEEVEHSADTPTPKKQGNPRMAKKIEEIEKTGKK